MINKNFSKQCLEIHISSNDQGVNVRIDSDYSESPRKSTLHVDSKRLEKEVENFWKSVKTKMLTSMRISFDEIDWYDDMVNMYDTPIVSIERGLKKARTTYSEHGSIPKDWSFSAVFRFKPTKVITPIMEVIELALGSLISKKQSEEFVKVARPVLQKVKPSAYLVLDNQE